MSDEGIIRPELDSDGRACSRRVVVVDDAGPDRLATDLQNLRSDWDVVRADDASEALAVCDRERIDIVIADMNTPPAGGLDLLQRIEARRPAVLRLIRFAPSDPSEAVPALRVVHQMIPRSCDPQVVARLIERLCGFRDTLAMDEIRAKLGPSLELPVRSSLHMKIRLMLHDLDTGVADVALLLQRDLALSSRVLQLANSPLFGARQPLVTIQSAISHLGLNMLKSLILVEEIFAHAQEQGLDSGFPHRGFHRHSLLTAQIARSIMVGFGPHEDAFVAGMLHDFGKLILQATGLDEEKVPSPAAGGYVLGTWGVPPLIAEAVTFHREPWRVEHAEFGVLGAVHLGNLFAECLAAEGRPGAWSQLPERTLEYLKGVGVAEDLMGWREVVARVGFDMRLARPRSRVRQRR
jgi:HD-like signal output (HDOD) protein/CheY-like chemotaxis protein